MNFRCRTLAELPAILKEGVIGVDRIHAFGREYGRARRILHNAIDGCDDEAMIAALEETLHVAPGWRDGAGAAGPLPPDGRGGRANP